MSRMFLGSGVVAGCSGWTVVAGGWVWSGGVIFARVSASSATDTSGGGVGSRGLTSSSIGSSTVWVSSEGLLAGAGSSCAVSVMSSLGGSSVCSVAVGGLLGMAATHSRSSASTPK